MESFGFGALVLKSPTNFAWYTGGADNRVDHASPVGVAAVLVTPEAEYVVCDNIEAARMREEQTPGFEVVEHPWHEGPEGLLRELAGGASLGSDSPLADAKDVSAEVSPLRYVLDEAAISLYRRAGADTVVAMGEAAASLAPGMSEHEAAANLVSACWSRGLTTPVVLVAADDRIARR
jgi:Xaa-Pro aminopeptidase